MHLRMAVWVQQDAIFCSIRSSVDTPDDEVLMTTAKQLRSRVKGQLSRPVLKTSRLGDGPA